MDDRVTPADSGETTADDKYLFFEDPRWFVEEVVPEEAESAPLAGGARKR